MSAIAFLTIIRRDQIKEGRLPPTDVGREIDFPYSGRLMMDILMFLEDQGVPIDESELPIHFEADDPYATVLTTEHRPLLPRLDPAIYPLADIRESLDGLADLEDDELQVAVNDALNVLRTTIESLSDEEVFVIQII